MLDAWNWKARRVAGLPLAVASGELLSRKIGALADRVPAYGVQAVARIEDRVSDLRRR